MSLCDVSMPILKKIMQKDEALDLIFNGHFFAGLVLEGIAQKKALNAHCMM